MRDNEAPLILTRRAILLAGGGIVAWNPLYAGEFWDKKAPADWNSEEIARLTTKSPWAKEVTATMAPGESGRGGGYPGGNPGGGYPGGGYPGGGYPPMGYPRRGGMGGGGMGGGRRYPGGTGGGSATTYKGTVRWESAQPILEAVKTPLPEAFANHYVIGVSGIPLRDNQRSQTDSDDRSDQKPRDENFDELKQLTTLQPHGKELIQPGVVQRQQNSWSTLLFGFSKVELPLTKKDYNVVFSTQLGRLIVKTRFQPSQMMYHKQLAV